MEISVIIPVRNRPRMLSRAIASAVTQTLHPEMVVAVDDGSTDETPEVIREFGTEYPDLVTGIFLPEHRGVSAARNAGIKASQTEWIALLDSDDEWLPDKLAHQQEFHRKHPEYKVFQCDEYWVRNGKQVNKRDIHRKKGGHIFKESLSLCLVSPSAVMIHRSIFEEIGYFDESMPVCEDYDFWLRVLVKHPIGLLKEKLLTRYGGHADQLSSQYWGMDRWRVQSMEKHLNADIPLEWKTALYSELVKKLEVLYQGAARRKKPEAAVYQAKIKRYQKKLAQSISDYSI